MTELDRNSDVLCSDDTGNRNASDNDNNHEEKRGCKRRLETDDGENERCRNDQRANFNNAGIDINGKAAKLQPGTVGDCDASTGNTSDKNNDSFKASEEQTAAPASASTTMNQSDTISLQTKASNTLHLPDGMRLEWNTEKTKAILHVLETTDASNNVDAGASTSDEYREFRFCLVGRAKVGVMEGSIEILGYTVAQAAKGARGHEEETRENIQDRDCGSESIRSTMTKGQQVVVTSPFWSSWMTIKANHTCLPCRITLDCIRGPESFQVMSPKRPIIIPEMWRKCGDDLVRDYSNRCSSSSHGRNLHSAVLLDSLEDYEHGKRANRKRRSNRHHSGVCNNDENRMVCMITGAKGVGKSTLLRYMTNRLLSSNHNHAPADDIENHSNAVSIPDDECDDGMHRVAILDTDVGQPELAPPGLLRLSIVRKPLLQPPYWNLVADDVTVLENLDNINGDGASSCCNEDNHGGDNEQQPQNSSYGPQQGQEQPQDDPTVGDYHDDPDCDDHSDYDEDSGGVKVVSSVFFGATTSKVDPTRFMNAVQFLIRKYETEIVPDSRGNPIPLLVNMDGWVKGMGYQILTALVESLHPTHLVQIQGETRAQTFDLSATIHQLQQESELGTETLSSSLPLPPPPPPPKVYQLPACQTMPGASLCRIPAFTTRNFRWATYFLPRQLQTFDAWDFASAKSLQTGWILATNSDKTATVPRWWPSADETGGDESNNDGDGDGDNDGDGDDEEQNVPEKSSNAGALNDECRLARALARERPYCVPMEAVDAFVVGSDFEDYLRPPPPPPNNNDHFGAASAASASASASIDESSDELAAAAIEQQQQQQQQQQTRDRIFRALNGSIVALCTDVSSMESLGYGILRSIDWDRRLLYVLVPPSVSSSSSSLLLRVRALVGGNLPLPLAMLYRGVYAESFPYLTTISNNPGSLILGSDPMKSRNNINRRGLANAQKVAK